MRSRLRSVTPEDAARAGREVTRRLVEHSIYQKAQRLLLYAAKARELPLDPLFESAKRDGKTILWPRVVGEALDFAECDRLDALVPGRFGIPVPPADAPATALGPGDLLLLPGLAFDPRGARLGRGRSFFDRALGEGTASQAFRCGVGYAFQWVPEVPEEAWDQKLDAFVSPEVMKEWEGRGDRQTRLSR
jgi:5-formyltetrahydrofolate cyclo-ligase